MERATVILETVAAHSDGITLAQLSEAVGLNNSTVFHLVKTLLDLEYLTQDGVSKQYRIGSRLFMFAASAMSEKTLLSLGTPVLERLSTDTGQAAHLAIRSNQSVAVIARTPAVGMLQMSDHVVVNRPPHATAIGKVLLSAMEKTQLDALLSTLTLGKFTENTITNRRALLKEIKQVRESGVALDNSELDPDVRCIAVPVYDFSGRCVAAMGISGPVWRMTDEVVEQMTQTLQQLAEELSRQLGYKK